MLYMNKAFSLLKKNMFHTTNPGIHTFLRVFHTTCDIHFQSILSFYVLTKTVFDMERMKIRVLEKKKEGEDLKKEKKKEFEEKKKEVIRKRRWIFDEVINEGRERVLLILLSMFERLRYEDLEEVYDDSCMVLWEKMNEKGWELKRNSVFSFMVKVCKNIGYHYLRGVRNDVISLEVMMEKGREVNEEDEEMGLEDVFDVMEEEKMDEDERFRKLEEVWDKLKDVDRMILECYYWEGCRMEEIAQRIGYKSADSVKSRKSKVLKSMMKMMSESENEKEKKVA